MGNAHIKPGSHKEWHALLETTTVSQIKTDKLKELVTVTADDDVKTVIRKLGDARLISAPVMDHSSFVDFVHLGEITSELSFLHKDRVVPEIEKLRHPNAPPPKLGTDAFFATNIRVILKAQHAKFVRAYPDTSLMTLAKQMSQDKIYRVAVCDQNTQRLLDVLTQSDIIAWISAHRTQEWFAKHAAIAVSTLAAEKQLIKVTQSVAAIDCFGIMRKNSISSVPVVLDDNRLFSVLSPSVLRGLDPSDSEQLLYPVGKFLTERKELAGGDLIVAHPDMTVLNALELMAKHRLRRLYVVNKYHVPVSVLSLTDIIAWLINLEEHAHKTSRSSKDQGSEKKAEP